MSHFPDLRASSCRGKRERLATVRVSHQTAGGEWPRRSMTVKRPSWSLLPGGGREIHWVSCNHVVGGIITTLPSATPHSKISTIDKLNQMVMRVKMGKWCGECRLSEHLHSAALQSPLNHIPALFLPTFKHIYWNGGGGETRDGILRQITAHIPSAWQF